MQFLVYLLGQALYIIPIAVALFAEEMGFYTKLAILLVSSIAAASIMYFRFYRKIVAATDATKQNTAKQFFEDLKEEYKSAVGDDFDLRVNFMCKKNRWFWPPWGKYLEIKYDDDNYSSAERSIKWDYWRVSIPFKSDGIGWKKTTGTCTEVMVDPDHDIHFFDGRNYGTVDILKDALSLDDSEAHVFSDIQSVVSVAVYRPDDNPTVDKPSAVLNIDSEYDIADTEFDNEEYYDILFKYARLMEILT